MQARASRIWRLLIAKGGCARRSDAAGTVAANLAKERVEFGCRSSSQAWCNCSGRSRGLELREVKSKDRGCKWKLETRRSLGGLFWRESKQTPGRLLAAGFLAFGGLSC